MGLPLNILLATLLLSSSAPAVQQPCWQEESLLIFQLRLDNRLLIEDFLVGETSENYYLPLRSLFQALELAVAVDVAKGSFSGWLLRESQTVKGHIRDAVLEIEGSFHSFQPGDLIWCAEDFYGETHWLSSWLPIDFVIDPFQAIIHVVAREPLPLQSRLQRLAQRELLQNPEAYHPTGIPAPSHYRLIDWPILDLTLTTAYREATQQHLQTNASIKGQNDLGWMSGNYFVSVAQTDEEGFSLNSAQLELSRRDPQARLLGPLRATEISIGDIQSSSHQFIGRSLPGLGIQITNFPLERPQTFDRTDLTGHLLPGWEVELYRNGSLMDFRSDDGANTYLFRDVPLYVGENRFTLVFYGPQGQERRQTEVFRVDGSLQEPGKTYYRFAVNRPGQSLFPTSDIIPTQTEPRYFFDLEHGFNRHLSINTRLAHLPVDEERRFYSGFGLRTAYQRSALGTSVIHDSRGLALIDAQLQTSWGQQRLNLSHLRANSFESDLIREPGLSQKTHLRINGLLYRHRNMRAGHAFSLQDQVFRTGETRLQQMVQGSLTHPRFAFSNALTWFQNAIPGQSLSKGLSGSFLANTRWQHLQLRLRGSYGLEPHTQLQTLAIESNKKVGVHLQFRAQISKDFQTLKQTLVKTSLTRQFRKTLVSIDVAHSTRSGWSANLSLSAQVFRDPLTQNWQAHGEQSSSKGQVLARAFLDADQNGRFDDSDIPLARVGFRLNGIPTQERTHAGGVASFERVPSFQTFDLALDTDSLADPFLVPVLPIQSGQIRPGRITTFDFPLVESGEIEGTICREATSGKQYLGGITLLLHNDKGALVATTQTEYDGFFLFERLIPGRYRVLGKHLSEHSEPQLLSESKLIIVTSGKSTIINLLLP